MKLKDVIHFYIGCKVKHSALKNYRILTGKWMQSLLEKGIEFKPILRPLSSLTEDEMKEVYCCDCWAKCTKTEILEIGFDGENTNCIQIKYEGRINTATGSRLGYERFYFNSLSSYQFQWLISRGFDMFQLIPQCQALDTTTITNKE